MPAALLVGRVVLAAVFLIAGVAKLADVPGSRRAVGEFGVPARFAGTVGVLLPIVELAVAVALVPRATAPLGAAAAAVLLTGFAAAVARAMARRERPDCHCFGQLHSAPAGPGALARNVVLAGLAGFVAVAGWHQGGTSATHWVTTLDTTQAVGVIAGLLLAAAVTFLGWFSLQLLAQNGRLLARVQTLEAHVGVAEGSRADGDAPAGLAIGSPAPSFSLPTASGGTGSLGTLLAQERRLMLVFSDPGCGPCTALLPEIADWQADVRPRVTVALVSQGDGAATRAKAEEHGLENVFLDEDREVSTRYLVQATPSAVIVDRRGRIASPLSVGGRVARRRAQADGDLHRQHRREPCSSAALACPA